MLGRDLVLVLGYRLLAPRGLELEVSFLGKLATWVLYAALCFVVVTEEGTTWPQGPRVDRGRARPRRSAQYVVRARRATTAQALSGSGREVAAGGEDV